MNFLQILFPRRFLTIIYVIPNIVVQVSTLIQTTECYAHRSGVANPGIEMHQRQRVYAEHHSFRGES